ncbi:MAG: toprim domain-containing protein, partial [Bacteroidota bacterium]
LKQKESLRPVLLAAHRQYIQELKKAIYFEGQTLDQDANVSAALQEVRKRGYTNEDVSDWQLGYAPGQRFLFNQARESNTLDAAKDLFLVGDKADKYWYRVIIPIHDENGLLVGFAGRDVSGEKKAAKWINPTDTPLYKKEKTWFALHRAKEAIRKAGEAWILEGYNDVIAWHKHGLTNTIASCGTNITTRQLKILKRYCSKVVFCFDGDEAGIKAMIKQLPEFIKAGFRTEVVLLPDVDPDDFTRVWHASIEAYGLESLMSEEGIRRDGFTILIYQLIHGNLDYLVSGSKTTELEKASGAKKLIEVVASVVDESYREIYLGWIARESGLTRSKIDQWFKKEHSDLKETKENLRRYELPKSIDLPLKELLSDIERYQMFIANDRIWMQTGDMPPYRFQAVSNFSIEIIQHMQDEKFPMKLVKVRNVNGNEKIFDVLSEKLNTPLAFDNAMTDHGNFLWKGGRNEFQRLREYLFDRMGVGEKVEVLGWNPKGFWVWNNGITVPGKGTLPIDENGVFKYRPDDKPEYAPISYYIPSANKVYKHNGSKFTPQKKVILKEEAVTFSHYTSSMIEVHRAHGMTGLLFTLATCFLDIVEDKLSNFPLLFLYGPASSGKDQLIECCQSFFGLPQSPIHIG